MRLTEGQTGTKNNLITVKRSDFEVFQALANDSENGSGDMQSKYYKARALALCTWRDINCF